LDEITITRKQFWTIKGILFTLILIIFSGFSAWYGHYQYNHGRADQREEMLQTFVPMQLQHNNQPYCWTPGGGIQEIEQTKRGLWIPITRSRKP
jgi:hypothetical protein